MLHEEQQKDTNTQESINDYEIRHSLIRRCYEEYGGRLPSPLTRLNLSTSRYGNLHYIAKEMFPASDPDEICAFLSRLGKDKILNAIALPFFAQMPNVLVPSFFRSLNSSRDIMSGEELGRCLKDPRYLNQFKIPDDAGTIGTGKGKRIKLFGGTFIPLPSYFYESDLPVENLGELFVLRPTELSWQRAASADLVVPSRSHVPGAVGYLRYHRHEDAFVVTEIQSDIYGSYKSRSIKEAFKHWAEILVLGFEEYCNTLPDPIRPKRIFIVNSDYQHKRWPRDEDSAPSIYGGYENRIKGIAEPLSRHLYEYVPEKLGYTPTDFSNFSPEKNRNGEYIPLETGWEFELGSSCGLRAEFKSKMENLYGETESSFKNLIWIQTLEINGDVCSKAITVDEEENRRFAEQVEGVAIRSRLYPNEWIPFQDEVSLYLSREGSFIPERFQGVIFSPGNNKEYGDWDKLERSIESDGEPTMVHLSDRERHPLVVFGKGRLNNGCLFSIGFKGAGVRNPDIATDIELPSDRQIRLPIYRKHTGNLRDLVYSHRYWGGLPIEEGMEEYRHIKSINWLMNMINPPFESTFFSDAELHEVLEIPIFRGSEIEIIPAAEYNRRFLGGVQQRFGILKTIGRLDLRISQVLNRIFVHSEEDRYNLFDIQKRILNAIRVIYATHGYPFVEPVSRLGISDNGEVGHPEILRYLRSIGEVNEDAARKIFADFERTSLVTMASLHGFNGHFGGARMPTIDLNGAVMGGATTPRNMDISGCFHDLDFEVFVPPRLEYEIPQDLTAEPIRAAFMQYADLLYWQDSRFWMHALLFGRDLADGEILQEHPFDLPGSSVWRIAKGNAVEENEKYRVVSPLFCQAIDAEDPNFKAPFPITKSNNLKIFDGPSLKERCQWMVDLLMDTKADDKRFESIKDSRLREIYGFYYREGSKLRSITRELREFTDQLRGEIEAPFHG